MSAPGLHVEDKGTLVTLRLDRPDTLNSLTFELYRELTDRFVRLREREELRCVVVTGTGRAFCTGGDVKDIIGPLLKMDAAQLLDFTRMTCALVAAMRALRAPIVGSLNGTVAGAGAAIALACDVRVAAESARIAFLFVKVGLAGADMGAAYLLPRLVGYGRASELLMTGDFVDAQEALRIGLYNRVVPREALEAETASFVGQLMRGPREGLRATKDALEREQHMTLEQALEHEAGVQAELMLRPDFHEGFAAFSERRPQRFQGAPAADHPGGQR